MPSERAANVADLVRIAAQDRPDHPALIAGDAVLSWGQLDERVDRFAGALLARGLAPGDRVAVLLGNIPEFAVAYFGALRAGLIAVPVNVSYTRREIGTLLADCAPAAVVCAPPHVADVDALRSSLGGAGLVVSLDGGGDLTLEGLLAEAPPVTVPAGAVDDQLAVLVYTSGTSGRPRGAMLSHRALLANMRQVAAIDPPVAGPDSVILLVLPFSHIYGLNAALGNTAFYGATGVVVERFDPVETLRAIRRHGVTNLLGAPPMFVAWSMLPDVGDAFTSVRVAISGAASLPPQVQARVLENTGRYVAQGYGLTETAPVVSTTLLSEVPKSGSIGRPLPGVEVRILDDDGVEVEEGDPGELVVRGENLFSGYWPDGSGGADADGWFRTGDVAYADADGDLHLVDRRRELIIVSGFNVYPREVEEVLEAHPDVAEAAVIGMPHPYTGESVRAVVVRRPGARLTAEELIDFAAASLARFKCPTSVEFVAELPHAATGKVAKGRLREAYGG